MNQDATFYTLSSTAIIHELLGEEIIVANLDNGEYYSLAGAGTTIWHLLLSGNNTETIIAQLSQRYPEAQDISKQVEDFVAQLLHYKLVKSSDGSVILVDKPAQWPEIFKPAAFEQYGDMQDLLKLDPIHEVDEQGWPHARHAGE